MIPTILQILVLVVSSAFCCFLGTLVYDLIFGRDGGNLREFRRSFFQSVIIRSVVAHFNAIRGRK